MKVLANVRLVTHFSFEDEKRRKIEGTKIYYDGESINTSDKKGIELLTITSDNYDVFSHFPTVPAQYELDFNLVPGSKGTVKMSYVGAKLIEKKAV